MFLVDLRVEQVADYALRFVVALDGSAMISPKGSLHAVELEFVLEVADLVSLLQMVLRRLSWWVQSAMVLDGASLRLGL
ncbi:hypothetical protein FJN17_34110 [Bradyrhizobium symbiodeficiens]|uniref:Uncharacterized protein n=1 Tax=Bradyrhizobium symbiodeficiens TaxID=1404367 RepID=A0ABZ2F1Y6_9BRAD|nr:hypothetical protein [Bradyrhizobium symbiodeficiens]